LRKQQRLKAKDTSKTNLKTRDEIDSPRDEIVQRSERKMKVVNQKHDKNNQLF